MIDLVADDLPNIELGDINKHLQETEVLAASLRSSRPQVETEPAVKGIVEALMQTVL